MKQFFAAIAFLFFANSAFAGFLGWNGETRMGIFDGLKCSTGTVCTKERGKLVITSTQVGTVEAQTAATAGALTAAQCGRTFTNTGAVAVTLPEASTAVGCRMTFVVTNASNFDIDVDAADQILVLTNAAGDSIRNATLGNTVTLQAVSGSQWVVVGEKGTWTDNN